MHVSTRPPRQPRSTKTVRWCVSSSASPTQSIIQRSKSAITTAARAIHSQPLLLKCFRSAKNRTTQLLLHHKMSMGAPTAIQTATLTCSTSARRPTNSIITITIAGHVLSLRDVSHGKRLTYTTNEAIRKRHCII